MEKLLPSVKNVETFRAIKQPEWGHKFQGVKKRSSNVEASSSSERPARADLNQNKNCLDTVIDAEVVKLQPLSKKARYLESNINKFEWVFLNHVWSF